MAKRKRSRCSKPTTTEEAATDDNPYDFKHFENNQFELLQNKLQIKKRGHKEEEKDQTATEVQVQKYPQLEIKSEFDTEVRIF